MNKTSIEWTDATWNPIRGCSRVSEGCRNCYAEKVAYRFSGPGQPYEGLVGISNATRKPVWNGTVQFVKKHLLDPLRWKPITEELIGWNDENQADEYQELDRPRPRRIFVNSMSDLFHENVADEWIAQIFSVMAHCPQHTFQVLTKRPDRMLKWISDQDQVVNVYDALVDSCIADDDPNADRLICRGQDKILKKDTEYGWVFDCKWPLPNVWLGVSVENKRAKERIEILREIPAALRFLSLEPLIEDLGEMDLTGIGWVIIGGESGPGARPMDVLWAKSIIRQCREANIACFVKQLGSVPIGLACRRINLKDRKGGDWSEWPEYLRVRQFPNKEEEQ